MPSHFITNNSTNGESVFLTSAEDSHPTFKLVDGHEAVFADLHLSPTVPVSLSPSTGNFDLNAASHFIARNTDITSIHPNGVTFRRVDIPPKSHYPMHRTLTLDYGVVVAGTVELVLDSGEKRTLKPGDTIVQRATVHKWENLSETEWVRLVWVVMPIEPLDIDGQAIKEELRIS
jgi:quercetin dioxygenase-like cupin family protein